MNYKYMELEEDSFKHEIADIFKVDLEQDLFDIQEEVFNILQNREILEIYEEKDITLNKIEIDDINCFYIQKKENDGEYTFLTFDNLEEARKHYNLYINTKNLNDWYKSNIDSFEKFCKPGDVVDQDIVDEFINSLPPIINHENFVQAGEPYSHKFDIEDNKFKATYTTFEREEGHWIYKGNCFRGKKIDLDYLYDNFKIVNNFEKYNGLKLLLQPNGSIASLYKGNYLISLEINGDVIIADKSGNEVNLNDDKLIKSIENNTFDKNYEMINTNWLEFVYYEKNKNGEYEEIYYDSDTYSDLEEIGITVEDIKKELDDRLEEYILEDEENLEEI